jgi:hypothetical protein
MTLVEAFLVRTAAIVQSIRDDQELGLLLGDGSPLTLHGALWQPSVRQRGLNIGGDGCVKPDEPG